MSLLLCILLCIVGHLWLFYRCTALHHIALHFLNHTTPHRTTPHHTTPHHTTPHHTTPHHTTPHHTTPHHTTPHHTAPQRALQGWHTPLVYALAPKAAINVVVTPSHWIMDITTASCRRTSVGCFATPTLFSGGVSDAVCVRCVYWDCCLI